MANSTVKFNMRSSFPRSTRRFAAGLAAVALVPADCFEARPEEGTGSEDSEAAAICAIRMKNASCAGDRDSSPANMRPVIWRRTSTDCKSRLMISDVMAIAPWRSESRRSSRLCSACATLLNSSNDAFPLSVCATRKMEEINSRFSGWLSSARTDCSICARSSSASSRNDCNTISRLIFIFATESSPTTLPYSHEKQPFVLCPCLPLRRQQECVPWPKFRGLSAHCVCPDVPGWSFVHAWNRTGSRRQTLWREAAPYAPRLPLIFAARRQSRRCRNAAMRHPAHPKREANSGWPHQLRSGNPKYKPRRTSRGSLRSTGRFARGAPARRGGNVNWRLPPRLCWRRRSSMGPASVASRPAIALSESVTSRFHRVFLQVLELSCNGSVSFEIFQQLKVRPFQAVFLWKQAENHNHVDNFAI